MPTFRPVSPSDAVSINHFLNNKDVPGASVLGERKHIALIDGEPAWLAEVDRNLVGLLQTAGAGRTFEVVALGVDVALGLVAAYRESVSGHLTGWSKDGLWDEVLVDLGFAVDRTLIKMSAPLPSPADAPSDLSFVGFDDSLTDAWIDVNNDAFAGHNEQGGWTAGDLRSRQNLGWWDANGLRIGLSGGEIAAFCWTKVVEPGVGEIYAIGVASRFQGLGYGGAMTSEGLRYLYHERSCQTGVLYVDGANDRAVGVYEELGFSAAATDRSYTSKA